MRFAGFCRVVRFIGAGLMVFSMVSAATAARPASDLIDDRSRGDRLTPLGTEWRLVTDGVMGGVSQGNLGVDHHAGRDCLRMTGQVSTANNGGFVQMALNLAPSGAVDGSAYEGIRLTVSGNGERYNLHLRTDDLDRPWQSYRYEFEATPDWREIKVPFSALQPHRTQASFRPQLLRRLGIVAIGRPFRANLCVADVRFYDSMQ